MQRRTFLAISIFALAGAAAALAPLLTLQEAVKRVEARYLGRMIDAEVVPGRRTEASAIVYSLRWQTPRGDILRIRVSAIDGGLLDVDGHGMLEARRK
jgi:hypothetical protein